MIKIGEVPLWVMDGKIWQSPEKKTLFDVFELTGMEIYLRPGDKTGKDHWQALGTDYDLGSLGAAIRRTLPKIAKIFAPWYEEEELQLKLNHIFAERLAFATPEAYKILNPEGSIAFYTNKKGSTIKIEPGGRLDDIIDSIYHEIAGHEFHYMLKPDAYIGGTQVMCEIITYLVMREIYGRYELTDDDENGHRKKALDLLKQIEEETPIRNLGFVERYNLLSTKTDHITLLPDMKDYFENQAQKARQNLYEKLSDKEQERQSIPLNVYSAGAEYTKNSGNSKDHPREMMMMMFHMIDMLKSERSAPNDPYADIANINTATELTNEAIEILTTLADREPKQVSLASTLFNQYQVHGREQALMLYRQKCSHENDQPIKDEFISRLEHDTNNAWIALSEFTSGDNPQMHVTRTVNSAADEYYVCVTDKDRIAGEGYFWFDQGSMQCEVYAPVEIIDRLRKHGFRSRRVGTAHFEYDAKAYLEQERQYLPTRPDVILKVLETPVKDIKDIDFSK